MDSFLKSVVYGLVVSFLFGEFVGLKTLSLNKLNFSPLRNIWLCIFGELCYLFWGFVFGVALGGLSWFLNYYLHINSEVTNSVAIGISFFILGYFLTKWYFSKRELFSILGGLIISSISILEVNILEKQQIRFIGFAFLFLPLFLSFLRYFLKKKEFLEEPKRYTYNINPDSIKPYPIDKKVVFIGLDGCDWRLFNRFLKEGRLPNFERFIRKGTLSKVKTIFPTDSPLIWTSILAGKKPSEHGIVYWYKTKFPLLPAVGKPMFYPKGARFGKLVNWLIKKGLVRRIPFSTQDRKCKAVWNILSDCGKSSINIGWIYSWPAEVIKGIQVSWYMYPFEYASFETKRFASSNLPRRVYPESLQDELQRLIIKPYQLSKEELEKMYFPTEEFDKKKDFVDKLDPWDFAKDKSFLNIAHYLLDKNKEFDLFSLYLYGIDAVSHTYWPFFDGAINNAKSKQEILSVSNTEQFREEAKLFGKTILRYYEYIDEELGKLLKKLEEDSYNLIIVSDHGFNFDGSAHSNAPEGVFIGCGPYLKKIELDYLSIYDILPTVLVLSGLPAGEDMEGRVIKEIFSEEFLEKFPPQYIKSYERIHTESCEDISFSLDKQTISGVEKRLKALGYID